MNKISIASVVALSVFVMSVSSCKKKEDPKPEEQELITTLKLNVTDGTTSKTFSYKVENGFGGATAGTVQIDTVKLSAAKTYTVTAEVYNEKETPAENITEEVLEEKDAHLFLYATDPATGGGSISFSNGSKDNKNLPFNQTMVFVAGAAGSSKLKVNLIHEPTDKTGTTPAAAGGETDVEAVFPVILN